MKTSGFDDDCPTARCGGGSGGWASGQLLQGSDRSLREPKRDITKNRIHLHFKYNTETKKSIFLTCLPPPL